MSTIPSVLHERLLETIDGRTRQLIEDRRGRKVRRRGWLMRRALLTADVFGLTVAFLIAEEIYASHAQVDHLALVGEFALFFVSLPAWVVAAKLFGLYDRDEERADHTTADDVVGVVHLVTIGTWVLFAGAYLTHLADPTFPKLASFWALAIISISLSRAVARTYCRRQVNYLQNTIIVGADEIGMTVARKVLKHPEYGLNLVGFVDADPEQIDLPDDLDHLAALGTCDDVPALVRLLDVERVIVAFAEEPRDRLVELARDLNGFDVQVDIVPRLYEVLSPAVDVHTVEGLPLIGLRPPTLSWSSAVLKRSLDLIGSAVGLLLISPLFAVVALAVKLDSTGPVFFRQVRMGARGETFEILKFRTMAADAEARKADVAHLNSHLHPGGDPRMFKIENDPRASRVGRVLRRFDIDELPQLWNVFVGEMSLVGPRPLILDEHAYVNDWAERRLMLRPGMTGLWQVLGRSTISFEEMVRLDYVYVTSWSLWNDCRLLLRTIPAVVNSGRAG